MIEIHNDHVQGTEEWKEARLGRITASRIYDVIARTAKGAYTAKRDDYLYQIAAERMTGISQGGYTNDAMLWGIEQEANAKEFYAEFYGVKVSDAPFIIHREMAYAGASPDGIVNDQYLIEVKCPNTTTFLKVRQSGVPPENYFAQCQWQMAVTQSDRCDLVFYDPRIIDPTKQMFVYCIVRDDEVIANMEHEVALFNEAVEAIIKQEK